MVDYAKGLKLKNTKNIGKKEIDSEYLLPMQLSLSVEPFLFVNNSLVIKISGAGTINHRH